MSHNPHAKEGLTRRDFIRVGTTGTAGIALAGMGALSASAAEPLGRLPRRRYGRTGLEISALVGAADWSADVIPLAVKAGVNYWHKGHRWTAETMPEAIKSQPRESYYLEITVDRVGGEVPAGDGEQNVAGLFHRRRARIADQQGAGHQRRIGFAVIETAGANRGDVRSRRDP